MDFFLPDQTEKSILLSYKSCGRGNFTGRGSSYDWKTLGLRPRRETVISRHSGDEPDEED
eukprot:scaffold7693_cov152-Ochromonas_danica.AAC.1